MTVAHCLSTTTRHSNLSEYRTMTLSLSLSLSVLTAIFPDEPSLAGFIRAKDDGSSGDNWSYKLFKAPVPNPHTTFSMPDALPVTEPTVSEH